MKDQISVGNIVTLLVFTAIGIGIGYMLWGSGNTGAPGAAQTSAKTTT